MVIFIGCGSGEWECNDGQCINEDYLCDRLPDCNDESDELECGGGGNLAPYSFIHCMFISVNTVHIVMLNIN